MTTAGKGENCRLGSGRNECVRGHFGEGHKAQCQVCYGLLDDEPTIHKSGTGENEVFMIQRNDVVAVEAKVPKAFRVEAFCQLQQTHHFNGVDHKVHFLVGKVIADDEKGSNITFGAEKIFKLTNDQQQQAMQAERLGISDLQLSTTRRRPASDLVIEAPA